MEITRRRHLEVPVAHLAEALLDPRAHEATYEHMGHRNIEVVRSERTDDALEIEIVRQVDVEVPSAARRFVHPSNTVTSSDRWERTAAGGCVGTSDVTIAGLPVRNVGSATARPDDPDHPERPGCTYEITLAMTIAVPVVGERVARAMRGQLERQIDAQLDATEAWLAGDGRLRGGR